MNIIIIGFRGTGKTTVGKMLAHKLGRPFFDTDTLIQEDAGKTIKEIVSAEGWSAFREREKKTIALLSLHDGVVIALGGGAVCFPENVERLRKDGFFIWLTASIGTILDRLAQDGETEKLRPSLTGREVAEEARDLLLERTPLYAHLAHITIDTEGKGPKEVVDEILARISNGGMPDNEVA